MAGTGPTLERDGEVFVIDLGDGENRFPPAGMAVGMPCRPASSPRPPTKDPATLGVIKDRMYATAVAALRDPAVAGFTTS